MHNNNSQYIKHAPQSLGACFWCIILLPLFAAFKGVALCVGAGATVVSADVYRLSSTHIITVVGAFSCTAIDGKLVHGAFNGRYYLLYNIVLLAEAVAFCFAGC